MLTVDYGRLPWIAITLAVAFGTGSLWHVVLLVLVGPITGIPLLLYAGAAKRLPLTSTGLVQYITPVLRFILGLTVFHESMSPARWLGFGLV